MSSTTSLRAIEIVIRSILIFGMLLTIAASGSTIGYGTLSSRAIGAGATMLSLSLIGLVCEIIVIVLSLHIMSDSMGKSRTTQLHLLTVDIFLSSSLAFGFAIVSIVTTVFAASDCVVDFLNEFPHTPAYIAAGFGYLSVIGFIALAVTSGLIHSAKRSNEQVTIPPACAPPATAASVVMNKGDQIQYPVQGPVLPPPYNFAAASQYQNETGPPQPPGAYPIGGNVVQAPSSQGIKSYYYPQEPNQAHPTSGYPPPIPPAPYEARGCHPSHY